MFRPIGFVALALAVVGCHDGAPAMPDAGGPVDASRPSPAPTSPDAAPAAPTGPFPIVLVHGLGGFDRLGPLEYFAGVRAALEAKGRKVYTPALDAFNGSTARGAKLVEDIEAARQDSGAARVVLVAHSQGGLDSRWAAVHDPEAIAAIVTIGTPHHGSKVADVALGLTPGPAQAAASSLLSLLGGTADVSAALVDFSSAGIAAFNAAVPDVPGVQYFSIAGRSGLRGASSCPASAAPFIATWDGDLDPIDADLWSPAGILAAAELPSTPASDGLVTVPSAQWGTFLGCIPADHQNEICQPATGPGLGNGFDCLAFYQGLEAFLRDKGL